MYPGLQFRSRIKNASVLKSKCTSEKEREKKVKLNNSYAWTHLKKYVKIKYKILEKKI